MMKGWSIHAEEYCQKHVAERVAAISRASIQDRKLVALRTCAAIFKRRASRDVSSRIIAARDGYTLIQSWNAISLKTMDFTVYLANCE